MSAPSEATVELLADHIEFVPTIAGWHFDEWYPVNSEVTVEDIAVRLSTWANRETMPLMYAAVEHGVPLGSAALVVHDMAPPAAGCEDLTPWLSGVFVIPERRGTGLGPAIVGACETMAARLGYPEIYLFTAARIAERFYIPIGWRILYVVDYDDRQVTVMAKALVT